MMKKPNCPIIAIEEHYWDPELTKHYTGSESAVAARLTSGYSIWAACGSRKWTMRASTFR